MNKGGLHAPRFAITRIECFERPVTLRLPFRFGAATVRSASQAFVRATIRGTDGRTAQGMAAELMIPKWFDKSPDRSNAKRLGASGNRSCVDVMPVKRWLLRTDAGRSWLKRSASPGL